MPVVWKKILSVCVAVSPEVSFCDSDKCSWLVVIAEGIPDCLSSRVLEVRGIESTEFMAPLRLEVGFDVIESSVVGASFRVEVGFDVIGTSLVGASFRVKVGFDIIGFLVVGASFRVESRFNVDEISVDLWSLGEVKVVPPWTVDSVQSVENDVHKLNLEINASVE